MVYSKENLAEAAKKLISKGFSVIPCEPETQPSGKTAKVPVKGYKYISRQNHRKYATEPIKTERVLDAIFTTNANMIAVFNGTGKDGEKIIFIDIDSKNANTDGKKAACIEIENICKRAGLYFETTISNGGHGVFTAPADVFKKYEKKGGFCEIFTTNDGGYTVIAPSENYNILQGKVGEFPYLDLEAATALLDAIQAVLKPFDKETPAKETKPAKTPVNGLKNGDFHGDFLAARKEEAEAALKDGYKAFSEMKQGGRVKSILPFHCNNLPRYSDVLGLENIISTLQDAVRINPEATERDAIIKKIELYCRRGFAKAAPFEISEKTKPVPVPVEILPAVPAQEKKQVKRGGAMTVRKHIAGDILETAITERLFSLLHSNCPIALTAPAGSGKTYYIINVLIPALVKAGYGVCFVLPFRTAVAQQKAGSFPDCIEILEQGQSVENKNDLNARGLVTTYDKAGASSFPLMKAMTKEEGAKGWIIIIDEAHLLTEQYGIRARAIDSITTHAKGAVGLINTIYMTATQDYAAMSCINAKFLTIETEKSPKLGLEFAFYTPKKQGAHKLAAGEKQAVAFAYMIKRELTAAKGLPVVIRINHKSQMDAFAQTLIELGLCQKSEIGFFVSDTDKNAENPTKDHVEQYSCLPSGLKCVLVTSVFDQAINIKEPKDGILGQWQIYSIIVLPILGTDMNPRTIIQLYNRFRDMETVKIVMVISEKRRLRSEKYKEPKVWMSINTGNAKRAAQSLNGTAARELDRQAKNGYEPIQSDNKVRLKGRFKAPRNITPYQNLTFQGDDNIYYPNQNAINFACFQTDCMTIGNDDFKDGVLSYLPAERVVFSYSQIADVQKNDKGLVEKMELLAGRIKEEKKAMKREAAKALQGSEQETLKYIMSITKDPSLHKSLKELGIEPSGVCPQWIADYGQTDGDNEECIYWITKGNAETIASDFAALYVFFAKYGFDAQDCSSVMAMKNADIAAIKKAAQIYAAFWVYDFIGSKSHGCALEILNQNPAFCKTLNIKTIIAKMIAGGAVEIAETAQSKLDALNTEMARLESEGQNLKVIKQAIKRQTERMPKTERPVFKISAEQVAVAAFGKKKYSPKTDDRARKEIAYLLEMFGGVKTEQSLSGNGFEVEIKDVFTDRSIEMIFQDALGIDFGRAETVCAKLRSELLGYVLKKDEVFRTAYMAGKNDTAEPAPILPVPDALENFDLDAFFAPVYSKL